NGVPKYSGLAPSTNHDLAGRRIECRQAAGDTFQAVNRWRLHVPSGAQVQGQRGTHFPIVLKKQARCFVAALSLRITDLALRRRWIAKQHIRKAIPAKPPVKPENAVGRASLVVDVFHDSAEVAPNLHLVIAAGYRELIEPVPGIVEPVLR